MKKGTQVRLSITDMTSAGEGIGHSEGYTFFVAGGIIGDEVLAEVTLSNRDEMGFRMLIGREALRQGFSVDPARSFLGGRAPREARRRNRGRI